MKRHREHWRKKRLFRMIENNTRGVHFESHLLKWRVLSKFGFQHVLTFQKVFLECNLLTLYSILFHVDILITVKIIKQ